MERGDIGKFQTTFELIQEYPGAVQVSQLSTIRSQTSRSRHLYTDLLMGTTKRRLAYLSSTVLAFSLMLRSGEAQTPLFEVALDSSNPVFTIGSPVMRVDITITNHSDQTLFITDPRCGPDAAGMTVRDDHLTLVVMLEQWTSHDRIPCNHGGGVDRSKSQTYPLNIAKWFDFTRPGTYFIQATLKGRDLKGTAEKHTSNVLTIDIVKPNPR
jgi:hypothetical protein